MYEDELPKAERSASPIESSLSRMANAIDTALALASELAGRLSPILQKDPPPTETAGAVQIEKPQIGPQSPLHGLLLDKAQEVEVLNRRLSNILGRLTV